MARRPRSMREALRDGEHVLGLADARWLQNAGHR
jgi:hypothetical protein